ncbi:hypothetical protein GCM10011309_12360 [Litorimonas cladophorae]|uniref:Uncharacterized protein n=1 Tax=Litorimonas cladophorae TaxID=1220491 RepID=A0A918KHU2_9PROT|nr:hypothetical protein [Litorimonas cladophorae]GGX63856.1 hypothetical protein GCM10011309_12360 [Litorimonas cladophorae]
MKETSFIGKLICAAGLAALLGLGLSSSIAALLTGSEATELQIFCVSGGLGLVAAVIGGYLGWVHSQLIVTGAIFSTITNAVLGIFSI